MKFESVLFVGIGGGNDVFSTTLAMAALWDLGWRWERSAIAGVLSPFHRHTVDRTCYPGVWQTSPVSKRFLLRRRDERQISFIDAEVARYVALRKPHAASKVFGLSLVSGTDGLRRSFEHLAVDYDFIVLVDIGGDCFFRGLKDTHVLSPMFDAMVLQGFVEAGVQGILFEAGPGSDGELDPEALLEALAICGAEQHNLPRDVVERFAGRFRRWIEPYRRGGTIPHTLNAYFSDEEILEIRCRARAHLGTMRLYHHFTQRIIPVLCRMFYLIEPERIRNPFMLKSFGPREWFRDAQVAIGRTNNEANLEYLRFGGILGQFLKPSPLFAAQERMQLLRQGLQELAAGVCDGVWMFPHDWTLIEPTLRNHFSEDAHEGLVWIRPKY